MKRFNEVVIKINEADDQVIMTTFQVGLNNPDLVFSLGKMPPTSMTDLLFKAQKYRNKEDALIAKGLTGKWKKEELNDSQGKKKDRKDHSSETKASKSSPEVLKKRLNFTPLVMPANKIPKKYYRFHKDHGHYSDECHDLKEQIEELIQRGKLQKFVKRDH